MPWALRTLKYFLRILDFIQKKQSDEVAGSQPAPAVDTADWLKQ